MHQLMQLGLVIQDVLTHSLSCSTNTTPVTWLDIYQK
jgi:hypothetical protein